MCESVKEVKKKQDLAGFRIVSVFTAHDNPQCEPLRYRGKDWPAYSLKKELIRTIASQVKPSSNDTYERKIKFQTELGLMTPEGKVFVFSDFENLDAGPVLLIEEDTHPGELEWPGIPF